MTDAAAVVVRLDIVRRAWVRGLVIITVGAVCAMVILMTTGLVQALGSGGASVTVTREQVMQTSTLFASSGLSVLPALITALVGMSVLKAVGWGNSFIVATSTVAGVLAVVWATLSVVALLAIVSTPKNVPGASGAESVATESAAVGTFALAIIGVSVAITIREMLPLSREVREREIYLQRTALRSKALRVERAREIGVYARRYPRGLASILTAAWYVAGVSIPAILLLFMFWNAGEKVTGVVLAVITLLSAATLLGLLIAHQGVLLRFDTSRTLTVASGCLVAIGLAFAASYPLLLTGLSADPKVGLLFQLHAGVQWTWWLLLLASVVLPLVSTGSAQEAALPRLGLFGQVVVASTGDQVLRLARRQRAIDAARRRLMRHEAN